MWLWGGDYFDSACYSGLDSWRSTRVRKQWRRGEKEQLGGWGRLRLLGKSWHWQTIRNPVSCSSFTTFWRWCLHYWIRVVFLTAGSVAVAFPSLAVWDYLPGDVSWWTWTICLESVCYLTELWYCSQNTKQSQHCSCFSLYIFPPNYQAVIGRYTEDSQAMCARTCFCTLRLLPFATVDGFSPFFYRQDMAQRISVSRSITMGHVREH